MQEGMILVRKCDSCSHPQTSCPERRRMNRERMKSPKSQVFHLQSGLAFPSLSTEKKSAPNWEKFHHFLSRKIYKSLKVDSAIGRLGDLGSALCP